jgi:ribosomal protein L11 methylase PrmA
LAGAAEINGLDIDPLAVETAQRNAERNNCSSISFVAARAEEINLSADFVAANLLSGIIRKSWTSIMRSVKPTAAYCRAFCLKSCRNSS